jgi:hypothetical protein
VRLDTTTIKLYETKSGRSFSLDTRDDFYLSRALPFSFGPFGSHLSTTPVSSLASGADLSSHPRAHSTKQSVGVWHRRRRTDGLELPKLVRYSSVPKRRVTVLVPCAHGPVLVPSAHLPCEPARDDDRDGWDAAHFLIIVACVAGFLHLRPRGKQWGQFFGGGILALAYFALIIAIAAPR